MKHKRRTTKRSELWRFLLVVLVLIAYAAFAVYSYGVSQGLSVTLLTWAFFVFATPIADGGFLVAFPVRLITGFRMLYSQIVVWVVGVLAVASYIVLSPETFQRTGLLRLFHDIIVTPWPLGIILLLSAVGTYVSIRFDDDVIDVASAKDKRRSLRVNRRKLYYNVALFGATLLLYITLLKVTHTHIKLI